MQHTCSCPCIPSTEQAASCLAIHGAAHTVLLLQDTRPLVLVHRRPLSGPSSRQNHTAAAGGSVGPAAVRAHSAASSRTKGASALPPSKPPLADASGPSKESGRQRPAATPLAATKTLVPESAAMTGSRVTLGGSTGVCVAALPAGVKHAVAGAACSLLLQTNPPSHARDDWDVSLVSYREESQSPAALNVQQRVGVPVFFVLRASGGGVQSCSFVATQAGVVVCKARIRGRAMAACSVSIKVVAAQPSAAASSIYLVHPLPSLDSLPVGCKASLRLMVRALFAACDAKRDRNSTSCIECSCCMRCCHLHVLCVTGQRQGLIRQPLLHSCSTGHTMQARVQQQPRRPYFG